MKQRTVLAGLVSFVVGVLVATVFPALAQQESVNAAWQVVVTPYGQHSFNVVKHNVNTGKTLVLDCERGCKKSEVWRELREELIN
jgi:hypothetical protein